MSQDSGCPYQVTPAGSRPVAGGFIQTFFLSAFTEGSVILEGKPANEKQTVSQQTHL